MNTKQARWAAVTARSVEEATHCDENSPASKITHDEIVRHIHSLAASIRALANSITPRANTENGGGE